MALRALADPFIFLSRLHLALQTVEAKHVSARQGSVRHAYLGCPANPAPYVAADVLLIESHKLGQLGAHLEHALDLADVKERQQPS